MSSTSTQLVADFIFSPTNPTLSLNTNTVLFDATDSGSTVSSWTWDFGDGSTDYGRDLGLKEGLAQLVEALDGAPAPRWVRLLYAYPNHLTPRLLKALGQPVTPETIERISPWRFAAPLSPDMAARRERRKLDFGELLEFSRRAVQNHEGQMLIEGVGGIMVPLDDQHTVLDWMIAINRPVVLVAGSYLGSISHTLACLDVLAKRSLEVKAVVVNETPASTVPMMETMETMRRFVGNVPVFALPRLAPGITEHPTFGRVCETLR